MNFKRILGAVSEEIPLELAKCIHEAIKVFFLIMNFFRKKKYVELSEDIFEGILGVISKEISR